MVLKIRKYTDASEVKLKNKRVAIQTINPNKFLFASTQLSKDFTPRCIHTIIKDKVVLTESLLTYKGAVALYKALEMELSKVNYRNGNVESQKLGQYNGDIGFEVTHCEYFWYPDHIMVINCDETLTRVDKEDINNWYEL